MSVSTPLRLAVLLSGSGTTLQNLVDKINAGTLDAQIIAVVSSKPNVGGIARATQAGIPALVISRKQYDSPHAHSAAIMEALSPYQPDLIVLAGFMSLFLPGKSWEGRVMNVHPALIPAFCGKGYYGHHVHEAVLASGVKLTGATVHFVDEEYDHGPIILQAAIPVEDDDTPDTLATRVQALERELYPQAIALFGEEKIEIEGRWVRILD